MKDKKVKFLLWSKKWKKSIAWILVFSIAFQTMPVYAQEIIGDISDGVLEGPIEETEPSEDVFPEEEGTEGDILELSLIHI